MKKYRRLKEWEPIITELFEAGVSDEEMVDRLGLSLTTIICYRTRFGLIRRAFLSVETRKAIAKKYHETHKLTAVCNEFNVDTRTVYYWAKRYPE